MKNLFIARVCHTYFAFLRRGGRQIDTPFKSDMDKTGFTRSRVFSLKFFWAEKLAVVQAPIPLGIADRGVYKICFTMFPFGA